MAVIFGGKVIEPQTTNPGLKNRVYHVEGVPTDLNIGLPAASLATGMLAENLLTGFVYERTAPTTWVRIDTI